MTPEEIARVQQFLDVELPKLLGPVAATLRGLAERVEGLPAYLRDLVNEADRRAADGQPPA